MSKKERKPVVQMACTEGELLAIRLVAIRHKFDDTAKYIRSLITADVIAKKKDAGELAWVYGEGYNDWVNLSDAEKEMYMNQLGPVPPRMDILKEQNGGNTRMHTDNELGL